MAKKYKSYAYQKNRLILRDQMGPHFCCFCGKPIDLAEKPNTRWSFEANHIIPVEMGGSDELENLAASHKRCNAQQGNAMAGVVNRGGDEPAIMQVKIRQSRVWP
jgi:5-methylcytosine-specific restriction endonuclease McrA